MKALIAKSTEGAKILDLCIEGDKLIEQGTSAVYNKAVKGVKVPKGASMSIDAFICAHCAPQDSAFLPRYPSTTLSPTFRLSREFLSFIVGAGLTCCSSDPQSEQVLAKDDMVKIHIGAHIDGFAAISAETIVVGASAENPVTGRRADVLKAAWTAAEVAMRTIKVGNKNWAVTEAVARVAANWDCKPVEGEPL